MIPGTRLKGYLVKHNQPIQKKASGWSGYGSQIGIDFARQQPGKPKKISEGVRTALELPKALAIESQHVPTMLDNGFRQAVNGLSMVGGLPRNLVRGAWATVKNPKAAWRDYKQGWKNVVKNPFNELGEGIDYLIQNGLFGKQDMVPYKPTSNDQYLTDSEKNTAFKFRQLAENAVSLPWDYIVYGGLGGAIKGGGAALSNAPKAGRYLLTAGNKGTGFGEGFITGVRDTAGAPATQVVGKNIPDAIGKNWQEGIGVAGTLADPGLNYEQNNSHSPEPNQDPNQDLDQWAKTVQELKDNGWDFTNPSHVEEFKEYLIQTGHNQSDADEYIRQATAHW